MMKVPEGCIALFGTLQALRLLNLPTTMQLTDGEYAYAIYRLPIGIDEDSLVGTVNGVMLLRAGAELPK